MYNSPLKNSHSHPIHTCLATIASNAVFLIDISQARSILGIEPRAPDCDCLADRFLPDMIRKIDYFCPFPIF